MSISFAGPDGPIGTIELAKRVLQAGGDPGAESLAASRDDFRKLFQASYRASSRLEFESAAAAAEIRKGGLAALMSHTRFEDRPLLEVAEAEFKNPIETVATFEVTGSGAPRPVWEKGSSIGGHATPLSLAEHLVDQGLAEPGLLTALGFVQRKRSIPIGNDLLVALAAGSEYAPVRHWLAWGGRLAAVMRPGARRWLELIRFARESGGTLLVPVPLSRFKGHGTYPRTDEALAELAGLDMTLDFPLLANWLGKLAAAGSSRLVLGAYAYAPGSDHVRVQAVQEALIATAMKRLGPRRLALNWLATPAEAVPLPVAVQEAREAAYLARSGGRIARDMALKLFGQARSPRRAERFETESGEALVLVDASVQLQGPNYGLAKRSQRWRAYLASDAGYSVSYQVSPPARTHSVLDYRILRASYRGAPGFGIQPFEIELARWLGGALLLRDLHDRAAKLDGATALHSDKAIHGGLWRTPYDPQSVWIPATVIGWQGYFSKGA